MIDENNEQLGVMPTAQAIDMAMDRGLDLVEVSPLAQPPVCKIIDHGKFQYQQNRSEKKVKNIETKGVRLSLKIGQHDLAVKQKQVDKFLSKGHNVKIELRLKGREKAHIFKDKAKELMQKFIDGLENECNIDKDFQQQGPILTTMISKK